MKKTIVAMFMAVMIAMVGVSFAAFPGPVINQPDLKPIKPIGPVVNPGTIHQINPNHINPVNPGHITPVKPIKPIKPITPVKPPVNGGHDGGNSHGGNHHGDGHYHGGDWLNPNYIVNNGYTINYISVYGLPMVQYVLFPADDMVQVMTNGLNQFQMQQWANYFIDNFHVSTVYFINQGTVFNGFGHGHASYNSIQSNGFSYFSSVVFR